MNYGFETLNLGRKNGLSQRTYPVVPPAGVFISSALPDGLHQTPLNQLLQIVVERAWSQLVLPFRLARDFLHNAVAVAVFSSE